jgi:hypothetical protein
VSNSTIKRLEEGFIAVPTPDVLLALVDALELDLITAMRLVGPYRRLYERITTNTNCLHRSRRTSSFVGW